MHWQIFDRNGRCVRRLPFLTFFFRSLYRSCQVVPANKGSAVLQSELEDLCFAVLQPAQFRKLRHELDVMWGCLPPVPDSQPPVTVASPPTEPTAPPRRLLGPAVAQDRKRWVRPTRSHVERAC